MNYGQKIKAAQAKQKALMDTAKAADRAMTADENTSFAALQAEIENFAAMAENEKKLNATDALVAAPINDGSPRIEMPDTTKNAWKKEQFGEFVQACMFNPSDNRLRRADAPKNSMTMGVGGAGGFTVPPTFVPGIRMVEPGMSIIRPKAQIVPSDPNSPDAEVNMVALDQSGSKGVFGGVTVTWGNEGFTRAATEGVLKEITLKTNEVGAYTTVSNKLLRNSASVGPLVEKLLRNATINAEEYCFLRGSGVGRPFGIIGHPATVTVSRTSASDVKFADVVGMSAKEMAGGSFFWIASQSVKTKLKTMVDGNNNLVWQQNVREGEPVMLDGKPIYFSTNSPVLGSEGDLLLVDASYYLIKDGVEMSIFFNPFLNSRTGYTDIQINYSVDGQPWLTSPVMLEDGVSTVSPFIALK